MVLLTTLLAGCASVIQGTPNMVQVEHGEGRMQLRDALDKANAHCARYGKVATLDRQSCPGQCITQFRCE